MKILRITTYLSWLVSGNAFAQPRRMQQLDV
jgi:hypothetical protein